MLTSRGAATEGWSGSRSLQGERQDDSVQPDDPMLLAGDVEVVALDLLGVLLERHDRPQRRHLPERVGSLVEAVAAPDDLTVADRRALRAVDADVGGRLRQQPHEEIDAVDL